MRRNLSEGILELDEEALSGKTAKKIDVMAGYVLTYEDYYELDDFVGDGGKKKAQMGKIPYEEFAAQMASDNLFDNDVSCTSFKLIIPFSCLNNNTSFGSPLRIVRHVSDCSGLTLNVRMPLVVSMLSLMMTKIRQTSRSLI